jgi:predicted enzyme related to lactoylglutathione lyase
MGVRQQAAAGNRRQVLGRQPPRLRRGGDRVTNNVDGATAFYGAIFGWQADPVDFGGGDSDGDSFMWRLPGYGNFLAIRDPDIKRRHADPWVPAGFSDAIGWMTAVSDRSDDTPPGKPLPRWNVTFSVNGTDAVVERAVQRGATVVSPPTDHGGGVVRVATLADPQGAEFTVGTYDPSAM